MNIWRQPIAQPAPQGLASLVRSGLLCLSCLSLGTLASACKKDGETVVTPDDAADDADGGDEGVEESTEAQVVYPEQDPDPAELATGMERYLLGHYDEVVTLLEPMSQSLTEDSQIRARGIASSIFAMAAGEDIAENAHAPAELAVELSGRLADDELTQLAKLALASYHMGVAEYAQAQGEIDSVKDLDTPHGDLAMLLWSNAVLGQAFEDDKLKFPEKLDEAKAGYESVFGSSQSDVIKGRAADGITAIGFYKKDKALTCEWAAKAGSLYESVGASDYMKEGPKGPAEALRCG
jgi:hypothetical protein